LNHYEYLLPHRILFHQQKFLSKNNPRIMRVIALDSRLSKSALSSVASISSAKSFLSAFFVLEVDFSEFCGTLIAKGESFKCEGALLPEPLCDEPFFFLG
jgi:hypothetical protein